eukprot:scaffold5074_cov42-Attheya_sp.AAC.2
MSIQYSVHLYMAMAAPERREEWVPTSLGLKPSVALLKTAAAAQIWRRTSSLARWIYWGIIRSGAWVGKDAGYHRCPRQYGTKKVVVCAVHSYGVVLLVVFLEFKGDGDTISLGETWVSVEQLRLSMKEMFRRQRSLVRRSPVLTETFKYLQNRMAKENAPLDS